MRFIDVVLEPPSYGWKDLAGNFSKPGTKAILHEFFSRLNIFKDKKNWLSFTTWLMVVVFGVFLGFFIFSEFFYSNSGHPVIQLHARYNEGAANEGHLAKRFGTCTWSVSESTQRYQGPT